MPFTRRIAPLAALAVLALVAPQAARAQTFYASQAALSAAVNSPKTITFQNITQGYYATPPGVTDPATGAHFDAVGTTDSLFVVTDGSAYPGSGLAVLSAQTPTRNNILQITLPQSATAFGTYYGDYGSNFDPGAAPITFTLLSVSGGGTATVASFTRTPGVYPAFPYIGVTTAASFNVVQVATADNVLNTTNFVFGAAAPEPPASASLALGALGLGALALKARRRAGPSPTDIRPRPERNDRMRLSRHAATPLGLAALSLAAAPAAQAQVYDATASYSAAANPNGVWSEGYTSTSSLGSTFILYDVNNKSTNGLNAWNSSTVDVLNVPTFEKNLGAGSQFGVAPGQIALHPGPDNQYSVLRFTAPSAGSYTLSVQFFTGDSGDTDGTVFLNGGFATPVYFAPTTTGDPSYTGTVSLARGDVLSFAVGSKGSFYYDTTPLTVRLAAAPEPPQSAALGLGVLGVGALALRARRRTRKAA